MEKITRKEFNLYCDSYKSAIDESQKRINCIDEDLKNNIKSVKKAKKTRKISEYIYFVLLFAMVGLIFARVSGLSAKIGDIILAGNIVLIGTDITLIHLSDKKEKKLQVQNKFLNQEKEILIRHTKDLSKQLAKAVEVLSPKVVPDSTQTFEVRKYAQEAESKPLEQVQEKGNQLKLNTQIKPL